jgi:hypothetical protein
MRRLLEEVGGVIVWTGEVPRFRETGIQETASPEGRVEGSGREVSPGVGGSGAYREGLRRGSKCGSCGGKGTVGKPPDLASYRAEDIERVAYGAEPLQITCPDCGGSGVESDWPVGFEGDGSSPVAEAIRRENELADLMSKVEFVDDAPPEVSESAAAWSGGSDRVKAVDVRDEDTVLLNYEDIRAEADEGGDE